MKANYLIASLGFLFVGSACASIIPYQTGTVPTIAQCTVKPTGFSSLCQQMNIFPATGQVASLDTLSRVMFTSQAVTLPFAGINGGRSLSCFQINPSTLKFGSVEPAYYCTSGLNNSVSVLLLGSYNSASGAINIAHEDVTLNLKSPAVSMQLQLVNGVLVPMA